MCLQVKVNVLKWIELCLYPGFNTVMRQYPPQKENTESIGLYRISSKTNRLIQGYTGKFFWHISAGLTICYLTLHYTISFECLRCLACWCFVGVQKLKRIRSGKWLPLPFNNRISRVCHLEMMRAIRSKGKVSVLWCSNIYQPEYVPSDLFRMDCMIT